MNFDRYSEPEEEPPVPIDGGGEGSRMLMGLVLRYVWNFFF